MRILPYSEVVSALKWLDSQTKTPEDISVLGLKTDPQLTLMVDSRLS